MTTVSNSPNKLIQRCIEHLRTGYQYSYGSRYPKHAATIVEIATQALTAIATSDAAYHNLEHTVIVTLVGQELLQGKRICDGDVSPDDWLQFITSLLCHDIGYIKGICRHDEAPARRFITGQGETWVTLSPHTTGASLAPYHVDRGKQFVAETFANHDLIDAERVQLNIELTRFPVPNDELHRDTLRYPALARAADLIGQLGDPGYLSKLPALFREFEETGGNQSMGYRAPRDLRLSYPKFYWHTVYPYLKHGIRYLELSQQGKPALLSLYDNLKAVEHELMLATA
jgi:hypothetical protein